MWDFELGESDFWAKKNPKITKSNGPQCQKRKQHTITHMD